MTIKRTEDSQLVQSKGQTKGPPLEQQRSACIEREAAAVLRTVMEDDNNAEDGGCTEMGSLTGWQALAHEVQHSQMPFLKMTCIFSECQTLYT